MGYALWLVPSSASPFLSVLKQEMDSLRQEHADAPSFEPHATLIAGLQLPEQQSIETIIEKADSGVRAWKSQSNIGAKGLNIELKEVTTRGFFFQCILIALQKETSLLNLNSIMRKEYSLQSQPEFFPHISLLYSNINAEEARSQITDMEKRGVFAREGDGIAFRGHRNVTFEAVELYDCNGKPEEWKKLHRISLLD